MSSADDKKPINRIAEKTSFLPRLSGRPDDDTEGIVKFSSAFKSLVENPLPAKIVVRQTRYGVRFVVRCSLRLCRVAHVQRVDVAWWFLPGGQKKESQIIPMVTLDTLRVDHLYQRGVVNFVRARSELGGRC